MSSIKKGIPKRGLSGVYFDSETCRNIGVALLEKAYFLAQSDKPMPAGFFFKAMRNLLADRIRYNCAGKRVRNIHGQERELGYDDVPGMNNLVYSGEDVPK